MRNIWIMVAAFVSALGTLGFVIVSERAVTRGGEAFQVARPIATPTRAPEPKYMPPSRAGQLCSPCFGPHVNIATGQIDFFSPIGVSLF